MLTLALGSFDGVERHDFIDRIVALELCRDGMHSSDGRAIPLQDTRTGIRVDAEIARGFFGIICALNRAEGSFHANVAVFVVLDVAVVSNAPHHERQRPYS